MIEVHAPTTELELALLKGILDAEGLIYVVRNDTFGSMKIGPRVERLNDKGILVFEEDVARTRDVINEFLSGPNSEDVSIGYPFIEKLRVVLEFVLFGWFIPPRRIQ